MGREVYQKVLRILQIHKQNDSDSSDVQESLRPIIGKNRKLKDLVFSLEMLVWKENWYSKLILFHLIYQKTFLTFILIILTRN